MGANVFSFGAVNLVWYCLSGFSVLPDILETGGQVWLVYILCISNLVICTVSPYVSFGSELGEYLSCIRSVVCCHMRCRNYPSELYPQCG
jgi:hypothetical protein